MKPRKILIIRNSAIGDVAIAATLLRPYVQANPEVEFTMVSTGFLQPLFDFGTENLKFIATDFKNRHKGLKGLYRLSSTLRRTRPTVIADLHNVIRSRIICGFLMDIPCFHLDKQRKARKALTEGKKADILPTIRKYEEVLVRCGLEDLGIGLPTDTCFKVRKKEGIRKIGIAPFSKHIGKEWPITSIDRVLEHFSSRKDWKFYLFGAGEKERRLLEALAEKYDNVESLVGKQQLGKELEIIRGLDLMICTDSANLHFASYCGTPALSIWGATHPSAGFYGWRQCPENALQLDMECRPCSIYGNRPCRRKDYACMNGITPETAIEKIASLLDGE